jgi:hypothetical protein
LSEKLFFSLCCTEEGPQEVTFVSRFSPDVTASDVEKSLKDRLQLAPLACTRLKTKHNSYASFHVPVEEDDFHLVYNTGVRPNGCLTAPYYGRLSPNQIYTAEAPATSRPPAPGARSLRPPLLPHPRTLQAILQTMSLPRGGRSCTQLMVSTPDINTGDSARSHTHPRNLFDMYYQNVRGLRTH